MKQHYSILKLLIVSLIYSATYAQGEANIWYFGNQAGIDFSSGNPIPVFNASINTVEGCTTYSDAQGNLQFYTNGIKVWNKNHGIMPNGTGLFGDFSSTQAAVIVPKPGSANLFYIFTTNAFEGDGGFRYSIVDMSANGNTGAVLDKNILLTNETCEKLSVIRHSNGQDFWVVTHLWDSDAFYALRITPSGISPVQVTSHAGCTVPADMDKANAIGYMKFSPDGTKLVTCHTYLNKAELFDFDTTTGQVSNARQICNDGSHVYGAEFSPDNNVLYISAVDERKLFQFDLNAENIEDSKILLTTFPQSPGALQIAQNGKIYIAMAEIDKLSVINKPNKLGTNCNVATNAIDLGGRTCMLGLPNFNQSIFYSKLSVDNLCAGNNASFTFESNFAPTSVSWNFGDASALSNQTAPSHHYNNAGTYEVAITANYAGGSVTRTKEITITPAPVTVQIPIQTFCIDGSESYQLSSNNDALLGNQSESDFSITYFATLADAQHFTNPLNDNYTLTVGTVTLYAVIKSLAQGGCSAIAHFTLKGYATPVASSIADFEVCDGIVRDNKAEFDLDTKTDEILNGQTGVTVKYYESEEDAENAASPVSGVYTNITAQQTIYVRLTSGGGCHKVSSFRLVVNQCNNPEDEDLFPKFFTPNGDGYHDTWETKATDASVDITINIFDRYGRLLKTISQQNPQWDGTYAGRDLPSDDYWFVMSGKNIQEIKGHFALKR